MSRQRARLVSVDRRLRLEWRRPWGRYSVSWAAHQEALALAFHKNKVRRTEAWPYWCIMVDLSDWSEGREQRCKAQSESCSPVSSQQLPF